MGLQEKAQVSDASNFPRFQLLGVRLRGTFGDIDPLNKLPCKRAISRVQKGPL